MRHVFKIDDGETHWYSAESKEQALYMHAVKYGDYKSVKEYIDDVEEPDIEIIEDGKKIKVINDGNVDDFVVLTAREWAEKKSGFIASTVW